MGKNIFTFLLSVLFLLNLVATQDYIPRNVDIDRSIIPKNILVASYVGGRSHLKPMLDITDILVERGYNVILSASGNYTPSSEYPTVKQVSLGPPVIFKEMKEFSKTVQKELDFRSITNNQEMGLNKYKDTFEKYKNIVKDYNIDLLFCHVLLNDPCLDVAHYLKKPIVGFGPFMNAIDPKTYKSDPILRCNISLENASFLERFKCIVVQPIRTLYLLYPYFNQLNDMRKEIDVDPVLSSMRRLTTTTLVLVDTFFGYELPQSLPPNIQEIGPVLSKEYPSLTPELFDFMNNHKRVLYVSFGTHFWMSTENNNKILRSLVESTNKNLFDGVIWPLSQTSKDEFDPTLTLADGTQIQTSTILNNEHPHIKIIKFAPQFSVLNHTNTKLFFSHGGAGSSHESLYTGTPMLVLPIFGDQMGNSEKLKSAGVALTLNKLNLDVNDIINKMEFLLGDDNVKKSLKRLEVLAKINSKRKYRGADLIEYVLHNSGLNNEGGIVNGEFLKEWIPADTRMGFIRGNNYDILLSLLSIIIGFIGGSLWITIKLIRFILKKIPSSADKRPKRD